MDTRIDLELLDRYLAGACTPRERSEVERWLAADPARSIEVLKTRGLQDYPQGFDDANLAWRRVSQRIHTPSLAQRRTRPTALGRPVWYTLAGLAMGVILVLAGLRVGTTKWMNHRATETTAYVTNNGQRANITLPDGNTVALNVASRLDVPVDYASGNHTLRLSGEALFVVTHHAGSPLTVVTGNTSAHVLGTSFLVRHYSTDTATTVAVQEGKVAVRSIVVVAAQQLVIGTGETPRIQAADPAQFGFASGVLKLNSAPFHDAVAELDRWYDADIRAGDPMLLTQHVTGQYTTGTVADLAEILEWTFNARVVRNGRVLTLFPR